MSTCTALGVMSGSSLDGLDLALCAFTRTDGQWAFTITDARTVPYDAAFRARLEAVMHGSALDLARLDRDLGDRIGAACREFLAGRPVDVIGSHGHTVFHLPPSGGTDEGLTLQIGHGARIAAATGITTVCDFRTTDVALGGQGAPLVPLGEKLLFPGHKAFLNIGGICNIALHHADHVLGYDVCIGNQALNFLAEEAGHAYDADGAMARAGQVNDALLQRLNALPFHRQSPPRSLGREWFDAAVKPLIADRSLPLPDRLRTVVEHIAQQVGAALREADGATLATGGGAHNSYLLERIAAQTRVEVPHKQVVDFKEALVFALLGVLRLRGEPTTLASVTGARRASVGGAVYAG
ncbi:MAG: anhydro-N-acetylmuramic acid kinase [Flavobacteriales bacterium]|jgi:anhydro-N-acetylmuramic acid kinase|nr:anhydro-N-acetylmuramic acid kinase [Flavobacteriales bacterium]